MEFTAIEHTDVRGNVLYYLKLKNNNKELLVNVGKKTHDTVKEMTEPEQPKLFTEEEKKEVKGKQK